jgi:hypothetical protein
MREVNDICAPFTRNIGSLAHNRSSLFSCQTTAVALFTCHLHEEQFHSCCRTLRDSLLPSRFHSLLCPQPVLHLYVQYCMKRRAHTFLAILVCYVRLILQRIEGKASIIVRLRVLCICLTFFSLEDTCHCFSFHHSSDYKTEYGGIRAAIAQSV